MKIIIEEPASGEEEQLILRCRRMSPELYRLISAVKTLHTPFIAYKGNDIHRISLSAVYYFEAIDNKVFVYSQQQVYETKKKLYELEEYLEGSDFIRISKSAIMNLTKVRSLSPAFSSRLEALLDNGEKLIVSRQYVPDLKRRLEI